MKKLLSFRIAEASVTEWDETGKEVCIRPTIFIDPETIAAVEDRGLRPFFTDDALTPTMCRITRLWMKDVTCFEVFADHREVAKRLGFELEPEMEAEL